MLFSKNSGIKNSLAVDCGTSGVRGVLFSYEEGAGAKPEVRQIIHVPMGIANAMTADLLRKHTVNALNRVWSEIPHSVRITSIYIGLSSPFYVSKALRISRNRPNTREPVTRQELDALIKESTEQFKKDLSEIMPDTDVSEVLVFNQLLLKTFLNGYRIENPLGKSGNTLEAHLRFEATTASLYREMTRQAASTFPAVPIRLVSIPLAYFYALGTLFDTDQGFLLVDVDAEISDISIVANGVLERVLTMPLGSNLFLREVAELLHVPLPDAAFIVRRYAERTLEETRLRQITPLADSFQKTWQARLVGVLEQYAKDQEIPPRIFFTGSGVLSFYQKSFTEDFMRVLSHSKQASVSLLSPAIMDAYFKKHQFSGPSDMALMCLALLCARGVL